jgi:hypothetical protein
MPSTVGMLKLKSASKPETAEKGGPVIRVAAFFALLFGMCLVAESPAQSALSILTQSDGLSCKPQQGNDHEKYILGCCGSPGRRECAHDIGQTGGASPGCTYPSDNTLRVDPFEPGTQIGSLQIPSLYCEPAPPGCDSALVNLLPLNPGPDGPNFTFYVASDIHLYRQTYVVSDQVNFVNAINSFSKSHTVWPGGAGLPASDVIAPPSAIVLAGDMTTGGFKDHLGAFRLLWEHGTRPDSIQFPVYTGLGNHDASQANDSDTAQRMYSYMRKRMCGVSMDLSSSGLGSDDGNGSENYSWTWEGVHFIQLNTWAGDRQNKYSHASNGLLWLKADLEANVGKTQSPVVIFQHYPLNQTSKEEVSCVGTSNPDGSGTCWWTIADYLDFWNVIRDYNIAALFAGHTHALGFNRPEDLNLPYTDSHGNSKILDNFIDGSGGSCPDTDLNSSSDEYCSAGVAHFLPARVATDATGTYLDVASFTLAAAENGGVPQPDAWFEPANSGPGYIFKYTSTVPSGATPAPDSTPKDPLFWGGTAACRKRLNTRYIPVSTDYATVSWDPNKTGNILVQTQGSDVVGPLAVEFPSEYTLPNGQPNYLMAKGWPSDCTGNGPSPNGTACNIANRSFVDSCSASSGNAYVLVGDNAGLKANTSLSVPITNSGSASTKTVSLVRLGVLGAIISPAMTEYDVTADWSSSSNNSSLIALAGTHHLSIEGPPNSVFSVAITVAPGSPNWLSAIPLGKTDAFGFATLPYVVEIQTLTGMNVGVVSGSLTITFASTGDEAIANLEIKMREQPSLSLVVSPADFSVSGLVTLTSTLTYKPVTALNGDENFVPTGQVLLYDPPSLTVLNGSPVASAFVNGSQDCSGQQSFPNNTVIFGNPSYCGSSSLKLAEGNHQLFAEYVGSGNGDDVFGISQSATLSYYVPFNAPNARVIDGDGQIGSLGSTFAGPIQIQAFSSQNVLVQGAYVRFDVVHGSNGASGTVNGGSTLTVFTDQGGVATAQIAANQIAGDWTVVATVSGRNAPLFFSLKNATVGDYAPPSLSVIATSKSGTFPHRAWQLNVSNAGNALRNAELMSPSLVQVAGVPCSPIVTLQQSRVGTVAASATVKSAVDIDFGSCADNVRFELKMTVSGVGNFNREFSQTITLAHQYP